MDAVEYKRGSQPLLTVEASNSATLVGQTLKNFAGATTPHCMVSTRKFTVYNKLPTAIKVIQRISMKAADVAFDTAVLDIKALNAEASGVVVVAEGGKVHLVRVTEMPDKSIVAEIEETFSVKNAARAVVHQRVGTAHNPDDVRAGKQVIVFADGGQTSKVELNGSKLSTHSTGAKNTAATASCANGLVAFADGKEVRVQTVDKIGTSILSKAWIPHGEPVDFVHILASANAASGEAKIITSAGNATRLWTVSATGATLHQTAEIAEEGAEAAKGPLLKAVDVDEDYLFIVDGASGRALAFELGSESLPAGREPRAHLPQGRRHRRRRRPERDGHRRAHCQGRRAFLA